MSSSYSELKTLIFNGRLTLIATSLISGIFPNREWFVSNSTFTDNLDGRSINDAQAGDLIIDSSKNRFEFLNFTGMTGSGLFNIRELPWNDQIGLAEVPYNQIQVGVTFMFRKMPSTNMFQQGREALGIPRDLVEYLSQKVDYQTDEGLCSVGPCSVIPRTILGSTGAIAPQIGQTGGILGDRPYPIYGDLWINPASGGQYV